MPRLAQLRGSAAVSFNDIASYMNVRENHLVAWAGQEIQVKLRPISHVAASRFGRISVEKRGCLFQDEVDSAMLRQYNEKACRFECRLKHAVNKVGHVTVIRSTTTKSLLIRASACPGITLHL